jgi:hypothetical protein
MTPGVAVNLSDSQIFCCFWSVGPLARWTRRERLNLGAVWRENEFSARHEGASL